MGEVEHCSLIDYVCSSMGIKIDTFYLLDVLHLTEKKLTLIGLLLTMSKLTLDRLNLILTKLTLDGLTFTFVTVLVKIDTIKLIYNLVQEIKH